MKTSEFIKFFEDEGLEVVFDVYSMNGFSVLNLKNDYEPLFDITENNSVDTDYIAFNNLPFSKQQEYYKVIFEYLMTPPEEREEEKKYYLRQMGVGSWGFLNFNINSQEYSVANKQDDYTYKTQFTQSEIDEMPECYTHPAVWEQVLVEE